MYLYNLTLQRATGIVSAINGNFSGGKTQEIVVARGKVLDLIRPDDSGKIQTLLSVEIFGAIRSLAQFRLTGSQKDYIVVGSDSGRIVILEYNKDKNVFDKIHQETFGKSGCRRIVPGQYLAVDPKGRAVMIGACEKQKLVYVLNRDTVARLTISSPLEAHKSHTIVYSICGIDCGFDNPIFAAIELDYSEADQDFTGVAASEAQKHLTFYELDLGLNHVSRKWSEPVDNGANMLVTVPGGGDGPSGVLVCAENFVIYKNQGHPDVRAVIPRRADLPAERGVLIVSASMHKQKTMFFFLLQTEYGDIFKVTLEHNNDSVKELKIKYFDTIPVTASMCVLKSGFLFAASEFGNHSLYQFQAIGDDADVESSSATLMETEEGFQPVFFQPRRLKNLVRIDQVESLMPIMDMKVINLFEEETPQIFTLCGRGPRSSLRILRPGLAISEMAVSELPGVPSAVWTVKKNINDEFDAYIVVSFANATLVLSIGETVEEVSDSGFLDTTPSLAVSLIGDDSLMQVHPNGIRHIREDGRINEWRTPGKRTIVKVGSNRLQVVIALSGGELIYFEVDMTGQLMEVEKHEMSGDVACLDIAPVPEGRQRSRFLAVGSYDNTIRILSLDPDDCMQILSVQSVSSAPESLLFLEVLASVGGEDGADHPASLFLNAALHSGVLFRTVVDMVTGQLSDSRSRFLGLRAPKLFSVILRGRRAILCLSSRPWLGYIHQGHFLLTPLSYETLEYASSFSSDQCAEGVVAVAGNFLRVFTIERLGETFNETVIPLRYTPRKFVLHPRRKLLVLIESDQGAFTAEEREAARKECFEAAGTGENGNGKMEMENGGDDEDKDDPLSDEHYGYPKAESEKWVSCIRVLDPRSATTTCLLELQDNEAAFSVCTVNFHDKEYGTLLAVGTAKGLQFFPKRSLVAGYIHIYRFLEDGKSLELLHKTQVEGVPLALAQFQGRLLAGIGSVLRLYDLGKRRLLRKCENKLFPNTIVSIQTYRDRIYAGDIQESFHYCKYRRDENQLYIFADDSVPRWLTASYHVDFDTMAGADKFGNIYFVRLPQDVSDEIEEDPTGGKIKWEQGKLNGAPNKVEEIIQFHIGDVVTSLQKASLIPGGGECILYGTVMGSLGALHAFTSRDDVDFFSHLEMHLRQEHPPLCGRDHMAYRSAYFPVKDVIDGDLCEQFPTLPLDLQRKIADELDRTPGEILKKLEEVRNKII
ncbi:spliceosome-associated protein 130 A [Cucurbita pepo subsp. pepo]|uniref:Spliceosome-associated protein 130 A n=2 Tax=Cucurbita TaxID=3660 RepID=A0A6J1IL02_CUCMA|nr:spliceosome-associated protein 130 A [Cucurbita moschata]XP_022943185.1 spliceosome-associated protein 130 A [Cucurbita moschata]XP_022976058.1 spliceosome-associated protein 130 A [Cucurbita maxima]XP_022976066.1 spliceosome-associated protein 130 A [Cucurbita maxima]XP_023547305.1 spliceosome-associated protein 130 A [Cucurbita pepo subsp. pepo]